MKDNNIEDYKEFVEKLYELRGLCYCIIDYIEKVEKRLKKKEEVRDSAINSNKNDE